MWAAHIGDTETYPLELVGWRAGEARSVSASVQQANAGCEFPYLSGIGRLGAFEEGGDHAADAPGVLEVLRAQPFGHLQVHEDGGIVIAAGVALGDLVEGRGLPFQRRNL